MYGRRKWKVRRRGSEKKKGNRIKWKVSKRGKEDMEGKATERPGQKEKSVEKRSEERAGR